MSLPKVLLLGDSIRISYQVCVAALLDGEAEVVGPAENCQFSLYTLSSLERWIKALGKPDIVHWNNGIHDSGHYRLRSPVQIPIDMYRANLEFILDDLRKLTSKIIWASSTPVHSVFDKDNWVCRNEDIEAYNEVARELMEANGVPINDLHTLVSSNPSEFLCHDHLHLSARGQVVCAEAVVSFIPKEIDKDKKI